MAEQQVEQWRVIADYPDYEVSNMGNVRSNKNGKVKLLKPWDIKGYLNVDLRSNGNRKTFKVHRLVAFAFIEQVGGKLTVDHIDRDPSNNNINNLRWANYYEQARNTCQYRADIEETDRKLRQAIFSKEYREANKEAINAKNREYYHANRETLNAKNREYHHANRETLNAKNRGYYYANKETLNARQREKIQCECGASVSRGHISHHRKTDKHSKRLLEGLIIEN